MSLYVAESGPSSGPAVVFLHSAVAVGSRMWSPQLSELSADLRCLAVDLPGHASSSALAWESLDRAADDVADVIRTKVTGRAAVVGISLGGYVAVRLAVQHPQLLGCMVVSGVSVVPPSLGARMWLRGRLVVRYSTIGSLISSGSRTPVSAGSGNGSGSTDERPGPPPPPRGRPLSRQAVVRVADEMTDFTLPGSKQRFDGTVLVVAGEHESPGVLRSLRPLADRFTAGVAKYAPEAGHAWNSERPELFNAMVRSWVTEQRLPPRLRDPVQWTG